MNKQKKLNGMLFNKRVSRYIALGLAILMGGSVFSGCKSNKAAGVNEDGEQKTEIMEAVTIEKGINEFGLSMYQYLDKKDQNVIFSPFSISSALGMTFAGSKGQTAKEMQKVMRYPSLGDETHKGFQKLVKGIETPQKGTQLSIANSLWAQKDYTFLTSYFEKIQQYYGAGVQYVDYINETEEARQLINSWVEQKTRDKIKELIKPRVLTQDTRLVLVNAIYFLGEWMHVFNEAHTHKAPFKLQDGKEVEAEFMVNATNYGYYEDKEVQVVELPYVEGKKSMFVVLPNENIKYNEFEKMLNAGMLEKWSAVEERKVDVFLPSFSIKTQADLEQLLSKMGMTLAFTDRADFSGMTGKDDLKIDKVVHQAFIDVSEAGTEAAAATAVIMIRKTAVDPGEKTYFRANRPFFFFIRDNESGVMLFAGRVMNPTL